MKIRKLNAAKNYLWILCCQAFALQALDKPITLNIDNPDFRKLSAGVQYFEVSGEHSESLNKLALHSTNKLKSLLEFTGYFDVMNQSIKTLDPSSTHGLKSAIAGFEGVDLMTWKGIGAESITRAKLIGLADQKIRIELRTADLLKGQNLIGKAYFFKHHDDIDTILKKYVDRVLEVYTGKPGIFSSKIVFIGRKTKTSNKQVYLCDPDGGNLRQLTHSKFPHLSPSFSPDGSKILFTSYEEGNPDLYMLDLASNKQTKVSGIRGINSGGVFSRNGQLIAFSGSVRGNTEIFLKTTNKLTNQRKPLLQGHGIEVDPAFSPDNKWLAFVSGRYGNPHIFLGKLEWNNDQSEVKVVGDKRLTYAGWYNATPAFSPDSLKLAFAGFDRDINRFDLFLMNYNGTKLERLTLQAGDNESPTWSPNGQLIMFHSNRVKQHSNLKGRSKLFIMNRDGSSQRAIELPLYDAQTPKWGPYLQH